MLDQQVFSYYTDQHTQMHTVKNNTPLRHFAGVQGNEYMIRKMPVLQQQKTLILTFSTIKETTRFTALIIGQRWVICSWYQAH